jgi:hypothetical protein
MRVACGWEGKTKGEPWRDQHQLHRTNGMCNAPACRFHFGTGLGT